MGYPHKVFELICTLQSVRNWGEETGDRYIKRLQNSEQVSCHCFRQLHVRILRNNYDTYRYHKYLCFSVSFSGFLFFFLFFSLSNFGNPAKKRCRRNPETVIYVNTFIVDFTVDFVSFYSNTSMCTHICGVRKRYSLSSAEQMTTAG